MGWILNRAFLDARHVELASRRIAVGAWAALALAGCASTNNAPAPVEERVVSSRPGASAMPSTPAVTAATPATTPSSPEVAATKPPPPGIENAGKPGYYSVKPGDTLIRIGLETGQNWKDLMKWNNLENANLIEVSQVLRVVAPGVDPNAVTTRPVTPSKVEVRPLDTAKAPATPASGSASLPAATPSANAHPPSTPVAQGDDELNWQWPASGALLGGFDEVRSKGLSIGGKAGEPVAAAADGRVVYAGSGLRGYGNLVILKHNNTYLSAYAHNQTLLVKEEQAVKRGQKIAEMGSTDSDKVQLHFEIRKLGKPIDPSRLLPAR
jgi:lipoprotein NlpD